MKMRKILVFLMVLLLTVFCGCSNDEEAYVKSQSYEKTYRNVKVIDVDGEAILIRDKKEKSIYRQLVINGGDNIVTKENGTVNLYLDSDKYAHIYENSDVTFELEGNSKKGAIRIYLNKGKINSKIENKLSKDDCYEVHTPDAVMAVRGTEFEVEIIYGDGLRQTQITTTSGSVLITLSNDNGDQKTNEAGETTIIESKADSSGNMGEPKFKGEENEDTSKLPVTSTPQANITPDICPNCNKELKKGNSHLLTCGKGHYSCDSKNHSVCKDCKKLMCDTSVHTLLECNIHYPCCPSIYDGHGKLPCGHYLCTTINDTETVIHEICVTCKTYGCKTQKAHIWSECGCVYCEGTLGPEHIMCDACYRCESDGKEHGLCEFCYGCISDGLEHAAGVCNIIFE